MSQRSSPPGPAGTDPLLTVVTPVLNGGAHLAACLASVAGLARCMPGAVEHIIADGGSVDGSLALVEAARRDAGSPITAVLTGPDLGQSDAINRGVLAGRGRFVAWLNADDRYLPDGMASLVAHAAGSDSDVVVGRCRFVDQAGREVFRPRPPEPVTPEPLLRLLSSWFAGRSLVQPEVLVRRSVWEGANGLDPSNHLAMDHDLWLRLVLAGRSFETLDVLVAEQLSHEGQKTADNEAVVRQLLGQCSRVLASGAVVDARASDEHRVIRSRLDRLATLRALRAAVRAGLHRRSASTAQHVDAQAWCVPDLRRIAQRAKRVAAVDLDPALLGCPNAQVFRGALPRLGPSFDLVVALSPLERYGLDADTTLFGWVRSAGAVRCLGEPEPGPCRLIARGLDRYWAQQLSLPLGRSSLDTGIRPETAGWLRAIELGAACAASPESGETDRVEEAMSDREIEGAGIDRWFRRLAVPRRSRTVIRHGM
ncbi:MAG: glycosyltransferase [Phycisphaerales bacterium]